MLCECVGGTSTLGCLLMELTSGHQMVLPRARLDAERRGRPQPGRARRVAPQHRQRALPHRARGPKDGGHVVGCLCAQDEGGGGRKKKTASLT